MTDTSPNDHRSNRRRTRGEGALYQKPNGTWVFTARLPNGKRRSVTAKTKRELNPKMAALRREIDAGIIGGDVALTRWFDQWLNTISADRYRPNTVKAYRTRCRAIGAHLGGIKLSGLTPEHVRAMYRALAAEGASTATISLTHSVLRRALAVAVMEGHVMRNVALLVEPPRPTKPGTRGSLALDEVAALLSWLELEGAPYQRARWTLALLTGLRPGEALGLRWDDVELGDSKGVTTGNTFGGFLTVRQQLIYVRGQGCVLGELKTERAYRSVPIVPDLAVALEAWKAECPDDARGLVFPDRTHTRDRSDWVRVLEAASLPHHTISACRAAFASTLTAAGVHTRVIGDLLGHRDIAVTEQHYVTTERETLRKGLDKADALRLLIASNDLAA